MKKKTICLIMLALLLVLGGCQKEDAQEQEETQEQEEIQEQVQTPEQEHNHEHEQHAAINLIVGVSSNAGDPHYQAAEKFAEEIEKKSDGEIKATLFASGELGTEEDLLDAIAEDTQTVDLVIADVSSFAKYDPKLDISQMPFIFQNVEEAEHFMNGDIQKEAERELDNYNMKVLAYYANGFRYLTTTEKTISDAGELQGMKIAATEESIASTAIAAMGAMTMVTDSGALAQGLQQGRFDGYEGTLDFIYNSRLYQLQNNLVVTNHSYSASAFVISDHVFEELDYEYQEIIMNAALSSSNTNNQLVQQQEREMLEEIKNAGVRVAYPDLDTFWDKAQSVVRGYSSKYEGLADRLISWRNDQ